MKRRFFAIALCLVMVLCALPATALDVVFAPSVKLELLFAPACAAPTVGNKVTVKYLATNNGNESLSFNSHKVTDRNNNFVASGYTYSWEESNTFVSSGESRLGTFVYSIKQADINAGRLVRNLEITAGAVYSGGNYTSEVVTIDIPLTTVSQPSVMAELVSVPSYAAPTTSGKVSVQYRVTNTGNVPLSYYKYSVKDHNNSTVSSGSYTFSCDADYSWVNPGETRLFTFEYSIRQADITAGSLVRNYTVYAKEIGADADYPSEVSINVSLVSSPLVYSHLQTYRRPGYLLDNMTQVEVTYLIRNNGNVPVKSYDYYAKDGHGNYIARTTGNYIRDFPKYKRLEAYETDYITVTYKILPEDIAARVFTRTFCQTVQLVDDPTKTYTTSEVTISAPIIPGDSITQVYVNGVTPPSIGAVASYYYWTSTNEEYEAATQRGGWLEFSEPQAGPLRGEELMDAYLSGECEYYASEEYFTFDASKYYMFVAHIKSKDGQLIYPNGLSYVNGFTAMIDGDCILGEGDAEASILYYFGAPLPADAVEHRIDIEDGYAGPASYPILSAKAGTTVTITARNAPVGKEFDRWQVISGAITLADATQSQTTFVMPASAVKLKVLYKDKAPAFIRGDANGSRNVDSADAALILRYIVGLPNSNINLLAAKVTEGTGELTSADAAKILRYLVGLIPTL